MAKAQILPTVSPADIPDPTLNPEYYQTHEIAPTATPASPAGATVSSVGGFSPETYVSPYQTQLDEINKMMQGLNTPFTWDSDTDEMYQQYLGVMKQMGKSAFNNALGSLSSATGGRPNTWASSVASQAQNQYAQQASMAMPQFFQMALQANQMQNSQKVQYANYVLGLEDTAYKRWSDQQNIKWEVEQEKYKREQDAVNNRLNAINSAIQRANALGYVDNEGALVLGVKAGTSTFEAKNVADQRKHEIDMWKEQKAFQLQQSANDRAFQLKLEGIRHANDVSLRKMTLEEDRKKKLSEADKAKYDKYTSAFGTMVGRYYDSLTKDKLNDREIKKEQEAMYSKMDNYLNRVLNDTDMTDDAKNEIFASVQLDDFFMQYYEPRKRAELERANAGAGTLTGMPSSYNR